MEINFKKLVISEVLDKANAAKSKAKRIEILKQYNCMGLRDVLRGNFDDAIQWNLPAGAPPYEKMAPDGQWISLNVSGPQKLKYFVKGGVGKNMMAPRRERMFIELLETSHPADAELIISMKDKKLQSIYKNITKKLVQDTWPQLISK